jgi:tetratricopeptide (TPR) repeat protein
MYRRDFAAQKSFSKLRSAIAGLYVKKGEMGRAAQAYREACLLYPISPEAVFKYSQEVLLPKGKWDVILDLMDYSDRLDPNNRRTKPMRSFISKTKSAQETIAKLEPIYKEGKLNVSMKYLLTTAYYSIGRIRESAIILREIIDKLSSPDEYAVAWQIFMSVGFNNEAETAIKKFIALNPQSVQAWVDLSRVQHRLGKKHDAEASFIQAYRLDAQNVFALLRTDEELFKIASPLFQKRN